MPGGYRLQRQRNALRLLIGQPCQAPQPIADVSFLQSMHAEFLLSSLESVVGKSEAILVLGKRWNGSGAKRWEERRFQHHRTVEVTKLV
jgi:hypothetical protein